MNKNANRNGLARAEEVLGFQKLGELGEYGFSREEVDAALPAGSERDEVLHNVAGISRSDLEHVAIDLWGSFEVTAPDYRSPSKEVWAKVSPLLKKTIRALASLDEEGRPL